MKEVIGSISLRGLSKAFPLSRRPSGGLRTAFGRPPPREGLYWALEDVNLCVEPGQTVAIIGRNGAGKSTLLQLVAGILQPTKGTVDVDGRMSALLELGAGFNLEFTGRENVIIAGAILGFREAEMRRRLPEIEAFAEIGPFIDRPVKTYSTGMFMRLAFATAVNVDPDIFLIDEILAVGDIVFQHRCARKIQEFQERGKTMLIVTHDLATVKSLCDAAVLLEGARVLVSGSPEAVVQRYLSLMYGSDPFQETVKTNGAGEAASGGLAMVGKDESAVGRFGDGAARLVDIAIVGARGLRAYGLTIHLAIKAVRAVQAPVVGFVIRDRRGIDIVVTNTAVLGVDVPELAAGDRLSLKFQVELPLLRPGTYSVSAAIADGTLVQHSMCEWVDNAAVFEVEDPAFFQGFARVPTTAAVEVVRER